MNANGARPYCKKPNACVAGTRGKCRFCHGGQTRSADIIAYHNNGAFTLKEVATRFGITPQYVQQILTDAGVTARKQPHRSLKDLSAAQYRRFRTLCSKGVPTPDAHEEVRR